MLLLMETSTYSFLADEGVNVEPVFYRPKTLKEIENNLLLFYTRLKRDASDVLAIQEQTISKKQRFFVNGRSCSGT